MLSFGTSNDNLIAMNRKYEIGLFHNKMQNCDRQLIS